MTKSLKTCVVSTSAEDTEAAAGSTTPDDRSENSQERFTGKSARGIRKALVHSGAGTSESAVRSTML